MRERIIQAGRIELRKGNPERSEREANTNKARQLKTKKEKEKVTEGEERRERR